MKLKVKTNINNYNIIIGKRSFLSLSLKKINKKNIILSIDDLSNKSMYKMGKIVNPEMVSIKFFFCHTIFLIL